MGLRWLYPSWRLRPATEPAPSRRLVLSRAAIRALLSYRHARTSHPRTSAPGTIETLRLFVVGRPAVLIGTCLVLGLRRARRTQLFARWRALLLIFLVLRSYHGPP